MTLWQLELGVTQKVRKQDSDSDQSDLVFGYSNNEPVKILRHTGTETKVKCDNKIVFLKETSNKMASGRANPLQSCNHIFALIFLQTLIIIFFLLFVRYDPKTAQRSESSVTKGDSQIKDVYPLFQEVHVMIFIGFGFLMTFLKKYGLSAVSLNLMCSALAIEIFTLVYGFFHLKCHDTKFEFSSPKCMSDWPYIDVNVVTMISADFATAAVLISFGVVLGVTSPLQLIIMP